MLKVVKSIHVHAPPRAVFAYVSDTARNPEWIPSLMEVRDIEGSGLGRTYGWTYNMGGVNLTGQSTVVMWEPDQLVVTQSEGMVKSSWRHEVEPEGDGSRYTLTVTYEMPAALGGRFTERLLRRKNEREGDLAVHNLHDHVEALMEAGFE
jgi:uncharacterized membrane protein